MNLGLFAPVQFFAQHGEIAVAGRVQQADGRCGAAQTHGVARLQVDGHLAVKVGAGVGGADDAYLDLATVADQDRAVGQRMWAQRHQGNPRDLRMHDRAIGRQRVGGRTGRGGQDQPVRAQVVDEFAIDKQLEFDQAADGPLVDDHLVEGQAGGDVLAAAQHFGVEQHAVFRDEASGKQIVHARQHVVACDIGHEAQPPLVDADQRDLVPCQMAGGAEQGAVTAEHNGHIGALADGRVIAAFPAAHVGGNGIGRRHCLDDDGHATPVQIPGQHAQRFGNFAAVVFADQGNGPGRRQRSFRGRNGFSIHGGN